jgi:hypothetical protein
MDPPPNTFQAVTYDRMRSRPRPQTKINTSMQYLYFQLSRSTLLEQTALDVSSSNFVADCTTNRARLVVHASKGVALWTPLRQRSTLNLESSMWSAGSTSSSPFRRWYSARNLARASVLRIGKKMVVKLSHRNCRFSRQSWTTDRTLFCAAAQFDLQVLLFLL